MSTPVTTDGHLGDAPNFCKSCGSALAGGRFCPECGQAIAAMDDEFTVPDTVEELEAERERVSEPVDEHVDDAADEAPTEPHAPRPEAAAPRRPSEPPVPPAARRRGGLKPALVAGLIAGLVLIAAAVVAVFVVAPKDDGPSADTAYRAKVASAMGPVLGANSQASDALAHLRGKEIKSSRASDARIAVGRAQRAITLATGAVGAMTIPAGSEQLARDTRQALDRERAYYANVSRVLNRPVSASTNGLQESAADLTSALSVAGPTVAGTEQTVNGTSRLVSWARTIRKAHAPEPTTGHGGTGSAGGSGTATTTVAPVTQASGGQSCGGGVFAGPNTSCPFALNTRDAYYEAPGSHATVRVFSPVTDTTYTMTCAPSGSGTTCSGANNASVTF
jgi:hypothetical protein